MGSIASLWPDARAQSLRLTLLVVWMVHCCIQPDQLFVGAKKDKGGKGGNMVLMMGGGGSGGGYGGGGGGGYPMPIPMPMPMCIGGGGKGGYGKGGGGGGGKGLTREKIVIIP